MRMLLQHGQVDRGMKGLESLEKFQPGIRHLGLACLLSIDQ